MIVPTAPAPPDVTYAIGVTGSMNPAIHHLLWYKVIGAIDDEEYQAAIRFPFNTTTQLLSQLRFGTPLLVIQCQQNEWSIQGHGDESWSRMVRVASLVFEKLNETPVNGFSMTSQKHLATSITDVKSALAEKIHGTGLGFPAGDNRGSSIELTVGIEDYQLKTALQPSVKGPDKLFTYYQHIYPVPQDAATYFDLGKLIASRVNLFCEAQKNHCDNAVLAIGR